MMKKFGTGLALILLLFMWAVPKQAAAQLQLTTKGDNFWFGFMDNSIEGTLPNLWVFVSAPLPDSRTVGPDDSILVTLNIPGLPFRDQFKVKYGETFTVVIPTTDINPETGQPDGLPVGNVGINKVYNLNSKRIPELMNATPGRIRNNAMNIQSNDSVNVFILNQRRFTSDASIVYPSGVQGNEYRILSYDETASYAGGDDPTGPVIDWRSEFMIVATEDVKLIIEAPPSVGAGRQIGVLAARGNPLNLRTLEPEDPQNPPPVLFGPDTPIKISLKTGQTYMVQSQRDLTGTRIYIEDEPGSVNDCQGFAVFGGNQCTSVGNCPACDHIVEMMLPIRDASDRYILAGPNRRRQESYRVMAIEDNTVITVHAGGSNPAQTITLARAGQFENFLRTTGFDNVALMVTGDKKFLMSMNGLGLFCDSPNWFSGWGDPYLLQLPGVDVMIAKSASVNLLDFPPSRDGSQPWVHFLNILTRTELVPNIRINNADTFYNLEVNPAAYNTIASAFRPVVGFPEYSWASIGYNFINPIVKAEPALKKISLFDPDPERKFGKDEGFAAYLIGYANFDSYGYTAAVGMNQVALMEASTYQTIHNPCFVEEGEPGTGEIWFRVRGGVTDSTVVQFDPDNPDDVRMEDIYNFTLINATNPDSTFEVTQDYFLVSGLRYVNRDPDYPTGLIGRYVNLPAGEYKVRIVDYRMPDPCEKTLSFKVEMPAKPIDDKAPIRCYVPDETVNLISLDSGSVWCPKRGLLVDGESLPGFDTTRVKLLSNTGIEVSFENSQFNDIIFNDALKFEIELRTPTFQQAAANEPATCDEGCIDLVTVILRRIPEVKFQAAEALTAFDDDDDELDFGNQTQLPDFYFRLLNQTEVEGRDLRFEWYYSTGDAPDVRIPLPLDPSDPLLPTNGRFELPEFIKPPGKERVEYKLYLKAYTNKIDSTNAEEPTCEDSASKGVAIKYPNTIFFPNIFTPNGDGQNEVFPPLNVAGITEFEMIIYDRWGMEQYRTGSLNSPWDGNVNGGGEAVESVYFWVARYKSIAGIETTRTGSVTLLR